jgi:glutamate-5-semialdehyde dehydrogenase
MTDLNRMGLAAKDAAQSLATTSTKQKNTALLAIADALEAEAPAILDANAQDIGDGRARGLSEAMLDRLLLDEVRLAALAADVRKVVALRDPVGEEMDGRLLPNGMRLVKRRIPLGVVGVIYEARPNVTVDVASLCLKTGNASILRGGSETLRSNLALVKAIQRGLASAGLPEASVQYVGDPDRALVIELLRLDRYVDMIIPRGGAALHRLCREQGTIPVITGGIGICHIFVDESADLERAVDIVENAKVQRPSVCNALDTLLVHRAVAREFLPCVAQRLARSKVELRPAGEALAILEADGGGATVVPAGPGDFDIEWLSLILGIKVVEDVEEAIAHIRQHSTEHSESILTNSLANATRFVDAINSSAVFVNASTRFNDGGQFGLGAEVAVSTQKLHARGPMGLEELTTYKWIGYGDGQVRE